MNRERGLTIANTNFKFLDEGAYGIVFVDRDDCRIIKVLARKAGPEAHCAAVYESEAIAYSIAMKSDELRSLIPEYFGARKGLKIEDATGNDVTSEFYSEFNFELEFVLGTFVKMGQISGAVRDPVVLAFQREGIAHMIDASASLEGGRITKVIDFGMQDLEQEW